MRKTPQEFRRENVKELFNRILSSQKTKLEPLTISVGETWESDFTSVSLSFKINKEGNPSVIDTSGREAKGFVDGIFKACFDVFVKNNPSLANIKLHDYQVRPNFNKSGKSSGSDAKVSVTIMMEVKEHGIAEFSSVSRSILYSSFVAMLEAFQFYINCENTFEKIKVILEDASHRNRGDIIQRCLTDLSKLTEVNTYEQGQE